jgi:glycosyltransferase involved in cell wall biosynthesis
MSTKISVLVPVYNAENVLKNCVDSILSQSYKDFELILLDDGSTDNSLNLCKEYAQMDSRVVVIHKENGGIASARNMLLDVAKGEYIIFSDNDDFYLPNTFEIFINEAISTGADIVQGQIDEPHESEIDSYKPSFEIYDKSKTKIMQVGDFCRLSIDDTYRFYARNLWGKLYKRNLFEGFRLPDKKLYDGMYLNGMLFSSGRINKISVINITAYCHIVVDSSVSHSWLPKEKIDMYKVYVAILEYALENSSDKKYISYCLEFIFKCYPEYRNIANTTEKDKRENKKYFMDIKRKYYGIAIKNEYIPTKTKIKISFQYNEFIYKILKHIKSLLAV